MPLDFIDDGSGIGQIDPMFLPTNPASTNAVTGNKTNVTSTVTPSDVPEGTTGFDVDSIASSCDFSATPPQTMVNGSCVPATVDSSQLPDYEDALVFGVGGSDTNPTCFDVPTCFQGATPVTNLDLATCTFPLPSGVGGRPAARSRRATRPRQAKTRGAASEAPDGTVSSSGGTSAGGGGSSGGNGGGTSTIMCGTAVCDWSSQECCVAAGAQVCTPLGTCGGNPDTCPASCTAGEVCCVVGTTAGCTTAAMCAALESMGSGADAGMRAAPDGGSVGLPVVEGGVGLGASTGAGAMLAGSSLNVAYVSQGAGACLATGQCYVPIDEDPSEPVSAGWVVSGGSVQVLPAFCQKIQKSGGQLFVVNSAACASKVASTPVCEGTRGATKSADAGVAFQASTGGGDDASTGAPEGGSANTIDSGADAQVGDDGGTSFGDSGTAPATDGGTSTGGGATDSGAAINVSSATAVIAGALHSCALLPNQVACWGLNSDGELGNQMTGNSGTPVLASPGGSFSAITAGTGHTCALATSGRVECWGLNSTGELGNGTTTSSLVPVLAVPSGVSAISAGADFTCALLTSGSVECWGVNGDGQLGIGNTTTQTRPTAAVTGITNATAIAAGGTFACALLATGTVECWGANANGELRTLGLDAGVMSSSPIAIAGLTSVTAIAAGAQHACALAQGGQVYCWGANGSGQLGNGMMVDSDTPAAVSLVGATSATALAAGSAHTCAIMGDVNNSVECWGDDSSGQLGDGTSTGTSSTPVSVVALGGGNRSIAAGTSHTCVLASVGVECWDPTRTGRSAPGPSDRCTARRRRSTDDALEPPVSERVRTIRPPGWAVALAAVLLALGLRLLGIRLGLPFFHHWDECWVTDSTQKMLQTPDWQPATYQYGAPLSALAALLFRAIAALDPQRVFYPDDQVLLRLLCRIVTAVISSAGAAAVYVAARYAALGDGGGRTRGAYAALLYATAAELVSHGRYGVTDADLVALVAGSLACGALFLQRGGVAWATCTVVFAALAFSFKITAMTALVVPALALALRPAVVRGRRLPVVERVVHLAALPGAAAVFVVLNPHVFLHWRDAFKNLTSRATQTIEGGFPAYQLRTPGWDHLSSVLGGLGTMAFHRWEAAAVVAATLGLAGLLVAIRDRSAIALVALTHATVAILALALTSKAFLLRNYLVAMPALCIGFGFAMELATARLAAVPSLRRFAPGAWLAAGFALVDLAVPLGEAVRTQQLSLDARTRAVDWLAARAAGNTVSVACTGDIVSNGGYSTDGLRRTLRRPGLSFAADVNSVAEAAGSGADYIVIVSHADPGGDRGDLWPFLERPRLPSGGAAPLEPLRASLRGHGDVERPLQRRRPRAHRQSAGVDLELAQRDVPRARLADADVADGRVDVLDDPRVRAREDAVARRHLNQRRGIVPRLEDERQAVREVLVAAVVDDHPPDPRRAFEVDHHPGVDAPGVLAVVRVRAVRVLDVAVHEAGLEVAPARRDLRRQDGAHRDRPVERQVDGRQPPDDRGDQSDGDGQGHARLAARACHPELARRARLDRPFEQAGEARQRGACREGLGRPRGRTLEGHRLAQRVPGRAELAQVELRREPGRDPLEREPCGADVADIALRRVSLHGDERRGHERRDSFSIESERRSELGLRAEPLGDPQALASGPPQRESAPGPPARRAATRSRAPASEKNSRIVSRGVT